MKKTVKRTIGVTVIIILIVMLVYIYRVASVGKRLITESSIVTGEEEELNGIVDGIKIEDNKLVISVKTTIKNPTAQNINIMHPLIKLYEKGDKEPFAVSDLVNKKIHIPKNGEATFTNTFRLGLTIIPSMINVIKNEVLEIETVTRAGRWLMLPSKKREEKPIPLRSITKNIINTLGIGSG